MLTATSAEEKLLYAPRRAVRWEVKVYDKDTNGPVDLTSHQGKNWVKSIEINEDANNPVATATVRLWRELDGMSLVPGRTSYANQPSGGGAARDALQLKGTISLSCRLVPLGERAAASTRRIVFYGRIDRIDLGGGRDSSITLQCRDLGADLLDWFILDEQPPKAPATNWYTALTWPRAAETLLQNLIDGCIASTPWTVNTAVVAGSDTARPTLTRPTVRNGFFYKCTTGGTTHGATEPTWPTTLGQTVNDNGVVWKCEGQLPSVTTPVSPGWNVNDPARVLPKTQIVKKAPLLDLLRGIAGQIDWELRYRYQDVVDAQPVLQFYDPVPTSIASLFTITPDFYTIERLSKDLANVRNVVVITYGGTAEERLQKVARDSSSETNYGQRQCESIEAGNSNIDAATEAQNLADDILKVLKQPVWDGTVSVPLFPHAQIRDIFTLAKPNSYFDSDEDFIITGVRHSWTAGGEARTTWTVREIHDAPSSTPLSRAFRRVAARLHEAATFLGLGACQVEAYVGANQAITTGTRTLVQLNTKRLDFGGDWNTSTYLFTAPVAANYVISARLALKAVGGIPGGTQVDVLLQVVPSGGSEATRGKATHTVSADGSTVGKGGGADEVYVNLHTEIYLGRGDVAAIGIVHDLGADMTIQSGSAKSYVSIWRRP